LGQAAPAYSAFIPRIRLAWVLALASIAPPLELTAQRAIAERPKRTIQVEWATDRFDSELPFRERFNLRGPMPEGMKAVAFSYRPVSGSAPGGQGVFCQSTLLKEKEFLLGVGELQPNLSYRFEFTFFAPPAAAPQPVSHSVVGIVSRDNQYVITLAPTSETVRPDPPGGAPQGTPAAGSPPAGGASPPATRLSTSATPPAEAAIGNTGRVPDDRAGPACDAAEAMVREANSPNSTTAGASDTIPTTVRSSTARVTGEAHAGIQHHFDADFGVMHAIQANYWGLMTNSHFHVVPINRNESTSGLSLLQQFTRRASVFVGLAVQTIDSEAEVKDLFTVGSPVVGVGYRGLMGDAPIRLNAGLMFFKQEDANPLVTRDRNKRDAFVAVTLDLSIQSIVAPLAALLQ
jgi:hypothetical protein